jgi:hypothetical protein
MKRLAPARADSRLLPEANNLSDSVLFIKRGKASLPVAHLDHIVERNWTGPFRRSSPAWSLQYGIVFITVCCRSSVGPARDGTTSDHAARCGGNTATHWQQFVAHDLLPRVASDDHIVCKRLTAALQHTFLVANPIALPSVRHTAARAITNMLTCH